MCYMFKWIYFVTDINNTLHLHMPVSHSLKLQGQKGYGALSFQKGKSRMMRHNETSSKEKERKPKLSRDYLQYLVQFFQCLLWLIMKNTGIWLWGTFSCIVNFVFWKAKGWYFSKQKRYQIIHYASGELCALPQTLLYLLQFVLDCLFKVLL